MADIKIYGKLVANTEDQVVADASSIQDTTRNQKLSATLDELAQGTGLKVLEVNLNNYLSQDGLLALIQGINYATVDDIISYQFTSNIAVDSSYNAVHVTASVSGQGGIDLYLLKSINDQFSCMSIKNQGYNSKYTIVQNASLIAYGGYIRGIVVTNELVGNLCDLVNGRSELTSTKLTYWFPVGVLPTHIKLANDIIIDLQGNEYCAIGNETVDAEISNRVYLNVVKIDINGDFSNVSANDVKVVDFLWHHIENPSSFSFDDLPRFSDDSDVDDFPGSGGGSGSGGSGKLYEYDFTLSTNQLSSTFDIKLLIYESNFERFKATASQLGITVNTPQDLRDFINNTYTSSSSGSKQKNYMFGALINNCDLKYQIISVGGTVFPNEIIGADLLSVYGVMGSPIFDLFTDDGGEDVYYQLSVNNSCTLTEYGTSASGGDTPSQSESSYTTISIAWSYYDVRFLLPKFAESQLVSNINQLVTSFNQLMSLSLPTISSYEDLETLYNEVHGEAYEVLVLGGMLWAIDYVAVSVQCSVDGPLRPTFVSATIDTTNNTIEWSIDVLQLNNGNISSDTVANSSNFISPSNFDVDGLSL